MSEVSGTANVAIIPDLTQFTTSAVAIGNLVADAVEFGLQKAADFLKTLPAIGQELQDAQNAVLIRTGQTGDALLGLQKIVGQIGSETPQAFSDIADSVSILSDRFQTTDTQALLPLATNLAKMSSFPGFGNLADNTAKLAGVFKQFNIPLDQTKDSLDILYKTTQVAGISMSDLVPTMNSVSASSQGLGLSFQDTAAFTAAFGEIGLNASQSLLAMGKVAKMSKDDGITAGQEWDKLLQTFKDSPDKMKAFADGANIVGTRAARMGELVKSGALDFEALSQKIDANTNTIEGNFAATDTLGREWKITVNQLKEAVGSSAIGLNTALMDVLKQVQPVLKEIVTGLGAAIGPAISTIAGVIGPAFIETLKAIEPILKSFSFLLASVFVDAQPLINGFIDLIKLFAPVFTNIFNQITAHVLPALIQLAPAFVKIGEALYPIVTALGDAFLTVLEALAPAFVQIANAIAPLAQTLGLQIADAINQITPHLPELVDAFTQLAIAFVDIVASGILPVFVQLLPLVTNFIIYIADLTAKFLTHKQVLEPLVVVIGGLFAAYKGFKILSSATKALQDFEQSTKAGAGRIAAFFTASSDGLGADTTTIMGSTTVLKEGLDEINASIQQLLAGLEEMSGSWGYFAAGEEEAAAGADALSASLAGATGELEAMDGVLLETSGTMDEVEVSAGGMWAAIGGPITLIVGGIALLGTILYEVYQHFGPFHDAVDAVGRALKEGYDIIATWITTGDHLKKVLELIGLALLGPIGALVILYDKFKPFKDLINDIAGFFKDLFTGHFSKLGDDLKKIGGAIVTFADALWTQLLPKLGEFLAQIGSWIVGTALPFLITEFAKLAGAAISWILQAIVDMPGNLVSLLQTIGDWIINSALPFLITNFAKFTSAAISWILDTIVQMPGQLVSILTTIGQWIIESALPFLISNFAKFTSAAISWILDAVVHLPENLTHIEQAIVGWIVDFVPKLGLNMLKWTTEFFNWIADVAKKIPGELEKIASAIIGFINGLPKRLGDAGKGIWDFFPKFFKAAINDVVGLYNDFADNFKIKNPLTGKTTQLFPHIDKPFKGADGAILTQATNLIAGEAGPEVLIPLTRPARAQQLAQQSGLNQVLGNQGSGNVVQVYVSVDATPDTTQGQAMMVGRAAGEGIRSTISTAIKNG